MPEEVKPVGKLKPYNQGIVPVGSLKPINDLSFERRPEDFNINQEPDTNQFEQVLTNIPDINEAQKSNLRKLALNVKAGKATHEDLRDTILTYQNKNPKQDGSGQYYVTENMTAKPLASGERPPKGYDVANDYFGTQEEADKKGFLASAGSHLYNGVLKGVLDVEGLINLPYGMVTGEDADWYKAAQNRVESSLMKTPSYETEQELFDAKDMKGIGDFFDSDRYNFTKNTVQGAALSGLESITSFLLGTKGVGAAGTALSAVGKGSKILTVGSKTGAFLEGTTKSGKMAQDLGGAYVITLPEVLQYVDDAGIKGEEKYKLSATIAMSLALTEMIGGTEALFAANAAAKKSKSAVIRGVVDAVKRNADGPLTKEFLTETFKATTKEAAILSKSFMRELGENVLEEAGTEGLQEFEKKGLEEVYDHISKEDNFKNNPLSLQAFSEYYNSALQGGLGSIGAGAVGTLQKRSIDLHEKQSGNVFEVVKKGPEAVGALKENIAKSVQDGEITQDQAAELIFKVDAYGAYNKQTSGIALEDADKKKVFELSFEKSNLDTKIPTAKEIEELQKNGEWTPVIEGQVEAKKKQSKDIQNEINDIIQKAEMVNKTTTAAKKTVEDVDKKIESETEKPKEGKRPVSSELARLRNKFKNIAGFETMEGVGKPKTEEKKAVKIDERDYNAIPSADWNIKPPSEKFTILKNKLEAENETLSGNLYLKKEKGDTYDTVHINLPGKKFVATASSAKDLVTQLRGHFKTEFVEGDIDNLPVTVKPLQLTTGKTVLGVFNENNGRFIAYVREHKTGKSKYSEKEIEELQHMQAASKLTKAELEYYKQKRNQPPTDEGEAGATEIVPTKPVTPTSPEGQTITNETTETGPVREPKQGAKEVSKESEETTNKTKKESISHGKTETTRGTESKQGDVQEADGKSIGASKEIKLRTGKKREAQGIKNPDRKRAISHTVTDVYHAVLQYFAGKGNISTEAIGKLYKGSKEEIFKRNSYSRSVETSGDKIAPSLADVAHKLWENNSDNIPNATTEDYVNAIELAIQKNLTRTDMAKALNKAVEDKVEEKPRFENEEAMSDYYKKAEQLGIGTQFNNVVGKLEEKTDAELENLAKDQKQFDVFGNEIIDIIKRDDLEGDVFQKNKLKTIENEAESIIEGRIVFKRFSPQEQSGIARGGKIHAGASVILGTKDSTNSTSNLSNEEQENRIEEYAKEKGVWVENTNKEFDSKYGKHIGAGEESLVWNNSKTVIKSQNTFLYQTLQEKLDGITLFNSQFPEAAVKVLGFGRNVEGDFQVIIEQPFIESHPTKKVTQEQINKFLEDLGYTYENENNFSHKNTLIEDLHTGNVILTPKGNLIVIDPLMRLNTKEQGYGGKRIINSGFTDKTKREDLNKIVETLKKSVPNVKIVYDENLTAAGKWSPSTKTITINPYYAELDTPIHEVGHILIDAMGGMKNKVINNAINQLKDTDLWNQTKKRYPEHNNEQLGYEVLAEAIGMEGAGIFDKQADKNIFMKYLEYIFDWLKRNLGLEKNIAKNLAKQIIAGIGTDVDTEGEEVFQKEKGKKGKKDFKSLWEMTKEERQKHYESSEKRLLSFDQYRELKFGKLNKELYRDIETVYTELDREDLSEEEREHGEALIRQFKAIEKTQLREWFLYQDDIKIAKEITDLLSNHELSEDDRIDLINELHTLDELARQAYLNDAQLKLARHYWDLQAAKLSENKNFIYEKALKTDITPLDVHMKNLSHMPESSPELQQFSKTFNDRHFDMVDEASSKKQTYEKLGKKVIEETNKKLGLTGKALSAFSSDSAKYFEYMDDGKGKLLTLDQAKAKGLSSAQIEFLKYTRELIAERKDVTDANYDMGFEVLKTDPSFAESFKAEGMLRAVSNFLGSSYNLRQVRIPYDDPNTGISSIGDFATIEKKILEYGNKGAIQKAKSILLLMKYNAKARRQLKQGVNVDEKENPLEVKHGGDYSFDYKGALVGKFDRKRDKNRGYSKDFYKAGLDFIDDSMHVKHMSKLVPVVNSLEYMAKQGYKDVLSGESIEAKPNAAKWIDEWRKMHLFKAENTTDPVLDSVLKFLRHVTSATTMMFNVKASGFNLLMGLYNNWRAENNAKVRLGHKRLFGEAGKHKVNKDYAYGTINPYAVDILRKYKIVSTDADSNPKNSVGRLFEKLGHGLTRYGEFQIQGSMFLGLLSEGEYDSFKYIKDKHGVDHLVVKEGVDEAALKEKLLSYKDKVSDIQGKYAEKDRRNIMNGELGKAAFIFRVWIPDWWKIRFGKEYINADGKTVKGSWRDFTTDAFKELRDFVKEEGAINALVTGKTSLDENGNPREMPQAAKNFMANMKGAMTVAFIYSLSLMGGDDEKRKKGDLLSQALGNLLFIFDPETARFTITNPSAAIGTVNKFFDTFEAALDGDYEKLGKSGVKLIPGNKLYRQIEEMNKD